MRISDVSILQVRDTGGRGCSWMDNHPDERETYEDPITSASARLAAPGIAGPAPTP